MFTEIVLQVAGEVWFFFFCFVFFCFFDRTQKHHKAAVASEIGVQNGTEADGKDFRGAPFLQSLDSMGF